MNGWVWFCEWMNGLGLNVVPQVICIWMGWDY